MTHQIDQDAVNKISKGKITSLMEDTVTIVSAELGTCAQSAFAKSDLIPHFAGGFTLGRPLSSDPRQSSNWLGADRDFSHIWISC